MVAEAYADVREAWRTYLRKFNRGRGVIFVGHSQGTIVLRRLIREEIDPKPAVRRRLVSAILLGGNVNVKKGSDRGGDFQRLRACRRATADRLRDRVLRLRRSGPRERAVRAGQGPGERDPVHEPGGARRRIGPAHGDLPDKAVRAERDRSRRERRHQRRCRSRTTPWATFPKAYTARCSHAGGASVLQLRPVSDLFTLTPVPDATWGLHLSDANIALGNLATWSGARSRIYTGRAAHPPRVETPFIRLWGPDPIGRSTDAAEIWTWPTISAPTVKTWSTSTASHALPGATGAGSRSACSTCFRSGRLSRLSPPRRRSKRLRHSPSLRPACRD